MSAILSGDPFMSAPTRPADTLALTFTRKGYGRLLRDNGEVVSQHVVAEEAYERAAKEGSGVYRWVPAQIEIRVP